MALTADDRERIQHFRDRMVQHYSADTRFWSVTHDDRADESTLATRWQVSERIWLELAIRPLLPHLRVGIMTDDRWLNEELEEAIEESGDEMDEFIEAAFDAVGLTWKNPIVEHYRDQGRYFYFATAYDLRELPRIAEEQTFETARQMLEGYFDAFRSRIDRANAVAPKP